VNGVVAGFITTVLIFVFGEILPQAVFPRFALEIGYRLSWLVTTTRIVFYPVAAPIAWILDRALGEEKPVLWSKAEIGEIIKYHEDVGDGIIDQDEERIILGALSFSELRVADIMIKGDDIFSLDGDILIDGKILDQIRQKGFGKIPVYNNISKQVTGIIYSKNLIGLSDANNKKAKELCTRDHLILINEHMRLDKLLNTFVHRKVYIAIVVDENEELKGLVTFEDIMEEILRMELEEIKH
jgi:metal transporter CNNM